MTINKARIMEINSNRKKSEIAVSPLEKLENIKFVNSRHHSSSYNFPTSLANFLFRSSKTLAGVAIFCKFLQQTQTSFPEERISTDFLQHSTILFEEDERSKLFLEN